MASLQAPSLVRARKRNQRMHKEVERQINVSLPPCLSLSLRPPTPAFSLCRKNHPTKENNPMEMGTLLMKYSATH